MATAAMPRCWPTRLVRRGIDAEVVPLMAGSEVPDSVAVLVLGGGEDAAQRAILRDANLAGGVRRAADRGAPVLAVCAGIQILGRTFDDGDGVRQQGLGLLDVETDRLETRAVGEVVVEPIPGTGLDLGGSLLTGFENHGGRTVRGRDCQPLGTVRVGVGNGDGTDGVVSGHVIGTYLHGPVLARNPAPGRPAARVGRRRARTARPPDGRPAARRAHRRRPARAGPAARGRISVDGHRSSRRDRAPCHGPPRG